jgi:NADH-quinone oxidoreductase subunit L
LSSLIAAAELPEVGPAAGAAGLAWLLVALPAASAVVLLLAGRRANTWGHILGVLSVVATFVIGLVIFLQTAGMDAAARTRELSVYDWISVAGLHVDFGLRLDPLSLTFVLLITGVGSLIHIYSVGYMAPVHGSGHGEDDDAAEPSDPSARRRFFAQLNLFVAAMLVLVLGNNFVMLYLGWEGVGLASYLLIGFYQDRPSAATAAKKAFLMNRVGDSWAHCSTPRSSPTSARSTRPRSSRSPCSCSWARAASPGSSRCRRGSPTRWKAPHRSPRSSTRQRWSPRAST